MIEDIFNKEKINSNKIKFNSELIIDTREKNSFVPIYLMKEKIPYKKEKLEIGDYLISDLIIERKTLNDFLSSFYSNRLINQLKNLRKYPKKILILEGNINTLNEKQKNIINGITLSIKTNFQIPIVYTLNEKQTSQIIIKLLIKNKKQKNIRISKNKQTLQEKKEYILQGFPNIGIISSKKLIEKYKTIKKIINLQEKQLKKILDDSTSKKFLQIINN